jgi:hypothetical protein
MLKRYRVWSGFFVCLLVLAACDPGLKQGARASVAVLAPDGGGVMFMAHPKCKDPTVSLTDLSFDVDGKLVWETHLSDRSKGGARMLPIGKTIEGYSSVTHDDVTLQRVLAPESDVVLMMHFTDSNGFQVDDTVSTARVRALDSESVAYVHGIVNRKELGC